MSSSRITFYLSLFLLLVAGSFSGNDLLAQFSQDDMALHLEEARTYQKYPDHEQYIQLMKDYAADFPDICRLDTFGHSVGGRPLLALNITNPDLAETDKANFLYTSSMHGDEVAGMVLMLRLADTLLRGYGHDSEIDRLVDGLDIWINPLANPDGAYSVDQDTSLLHAFRYNMNNVDLNRDFPDPATGDADNTEGKQVETRSMMELLQLHRFTLSANIHGGEEVVNYPWDHSYDLHADDEWYRFISHEYADEAMAIDPDYMFGWPDGGITNGASWYVTSGSRQDYVNYYLEGREVTLELHKDKLLPSSELQRLWEINYRSLISYMAQASYGIRGTVVDTDTESPLKARIKIPGYDQNYSQVSSSAESGIFHRLLKEGSYDLVASAPGYLNDTLRDVQVQDYQRTLVSFRLSKDPKAGIKDPSTSILKIWPNPASEQLFVHIIHPGREASLIRIIRLDGRPVLEKVIKAGLSDFSLDISHLSPGLYLLQVHRASGPVNRNFICF